MAIGLLLLATVSRMVQAVAKDGGRKVTVAQLRAFYAEHVYSDIRLKRILRDYPSDKLVASLAKKYSCDSATIDAHFGASPQLKAPAELITAATEGCVQATERFRTERRPGSTKKSASFRNMGSKGLTVLWVSAQGEETNMFDLSGGQKRALDSYAGHAFVVRDADGVLAAEARVEAQDKYCTATAGCLWPVLACGDKEVARSKGTSGSSTCGASTPTAKVKVNATNGAGSKGTSGSSSDALPKFRSFRSPPRNALTDKAFKSKMKARAADVAAKLRPTCELGDWLVRETSWRGYHVLCMDAAAETFTAFTGGAADERTGEGKEASMLGEVKLAVKELEVFYTKHEPSKVKKAGKIIRQAYDSGSNTTALVQKLKEKYGEAPALYQKAKPWTNMREFRKAVEGALGIDRTDARIAKAKLAGGFHPQLWRAFNTAGFPIEAVEDLPHSGVVLIFEGGQFINPGIEIGFRREIVAHDKTIFIETLSLQPLVMKVMNFISDEECAHILEKSEPHMRSSEVSLMDKDKGKEATQFRTSETHFLSSQGDAVLAELDQRVANLTKVPQNHQESLQVLKYKKGQRYDEHLDYWDPAHYSDDSILRMTAGGFRNRMSTVFCYLSDTVGGYTAFPKAHDSNSDATDAEFPDQEGLCPHALKVHPQKGAVILFYSLQADGNGDELSQHTACPLGTGKGDRATKWSANKWVWNEGGTGTSYADDGSY
jgi:prolyl 4-hydroxylase